MDDSQSGVYIALKNAIREAATNIRRRARENHAYVTRTSMLEKATALDFPDDLTGVIFLDTKIAKYAPFIHEGTPPHIITPRNKKSLRWAKGGDFIFAKLARHPGWKGDPFLFNAADAYDPKIEPLVALHIEKALIKWANEKD